MAKLISVKTSDRVFETGGSRPVLITCDDFNDYVCKYNKGNGPAVRLACEFIAASFLKLWNLNVPDFALVNIKKEHIPSYFNINAYYFDVTCFGSKYSRGYADLHSFTDLIDTSKSKSYPNRNDLYYISLFDIWLGNDDRSHNNYNLLIDTSNQRNFVPIDHEAIFNTCTINNPIYDITIEASLAGSPLMHKMFGKRKLNKTVSDEIQSNFYTFVNLCQANLVNIIDQLPVDWRINKKKLENKMKQEIFIDSWLKNTFNLLLSFIQINSNS